MAQAETTLIEAVKKGDGAAVAALLAADPSLLGARSDGGVSVILLTLYYRRPEIARVFLDRGAEPDFHTSCAAGLVERVREMLRGDPALARSLGPDGHTAIGLAAFFAQPEVVKTLLEAGADPGARSKNAMGVAPVHAAAAAHHSGIMKMLLQAGADANARQEKGFVPLHEAASEGDEEMARMLADHGARIDARTDDGKTAEDLAREKGHSGLADWLRGRHEGL